MGNEGQKTLPSRKMVLIKKFPFVMRVSLHTASCLDSKPFRSYSCHQLEQFSSSRGFVVGCRWKC